MKPNEILIVDDTPFNIEVLQMMLKMTYGLACDTAYSGEEALLKIQERVYEQGLPCYSLIFMDINMTGMDGVQTT
jgi:CheY-like chemotaxis protein